MWVLSAALPARSLGKLVQFLVSLGAATSAAAVVKALGVTRAVSRCLSWAVVEAPGVTRSVSR